MIVREGGLIINMNEPELIHFLDENQIAYQRFNHAAVFTVEQASAALPDIPGAGTKNLFLYDSAHERFLLLVTLGEKRIHLKRLAALIGAPKGLVFAPEEQLEKLLGVGRGGVTALGLINDPTQRVELYIDRALWQYPSIHCHPLTNTATLVISTRNLERFFALTGHTPHYVDVPGKEDA
jgi:Ala-tRNA(Pro) deacylase